MKTDRLSDVEALHAQAESEGHPSYRDPGTGFQVWTRTELLSRGHCCQSGCRHCPYQISETPLNPSPFPTTVGS